MVLCLVYKLVDYAVEEEWKPCCCSAAARDGAGAWAGAIFVPPAAAPGPKVVRLSSSSAKMQLEDVSDTLYVRPSLLSDATNKAGPAAPTLTVSPAIAEIIRRKIDRPPHLPRQAPCWSDCDCKVCHSWSTTTRSPHLYVHVQAPPNGGGRGEMTEDVVFIHGFISSSVFWTETVFPAFTEAARGRYRMFAVDLLGFRRSPRSADSLYTLRELVEMIERSVLQRYRLRSFHVVAHSLGSVLALALDVKYPEAVKSFTLLATVQISSLSSDRPSVSDMSLDDQIMLQSPGSQRRINPFLTAHGISDGDADSDSTRCSVWPDIMHTGGLCICQRAIAEAARASTSHGRWSALISHSSYNDGDDGVLEYRRVIHALVVAGFQFLRFLNAVREGGSRTVEDLIHSSNGRKDSAHAIVDASNFAAAIGTPSYWHANAPGVNNGAAGEHSRKKLTAARPKHHHFIWDIDPSIGFFEPCDDEPMFATDAPPASTSANGDAAEGNCTPRPAFAVRSGEFILDSGASCHATGDMNLLVDFTPAPQTGRSVRVANGSRLPILGHGSVRLQDSVTLPGVLYVPGLAKNIVSVSRLGELDYSVTFFPTRCFIWEACDGTVVGVGRRVNGLFQLEYLQVPLGRARCVACVRLGSE